MAPKAVIKPEKLSSILAYFHKSGVAHNLKDLEKALPSVASINGMQVKDYLQALTDENKIQVDKIGTGNWYWSFPAEEARLKRQELAKVKEEAERCDATIAELQAKIEIEEHRLAEEGDGEEEEEGEKRKALVEHVAALEKEVGKLRAEVAEHCDNDPAEIEKQKKEAQTFKDKAEKWTEDIMEMEKYLRDTCAVDREALLALKREVYDTEFDEDEEGLRELPELDN